RLALGVGDDDVAGTQLLLVVAGAADGDRARVVEAVAERHVAAGDLTDRAFHELFAEDGDDAGERAHPAQALGAERGGAPAHRFRPGEAADDGGNRLGEHGLDRPARLFDDGEIHPTTVFELVLGETGVAQYGFERLGRRGGPRARGLRAHRLRRLRQIAGDQRQAARGGPDGDLADRNAGGGHLLAEQLLRLGTRAGLHPRGNLFGAEFEEEIAHADHPAYCSAQRAEVLAIQASQLPLARSRTRAM